MFSRYYEGKGNHLYQLKKIKKKYLEEKIMNLMMFILPAMAVVLLSLPLVKNVYF